MMAPQRAPAFTLKTTDFDMSCLSRSVLSESCYHQTRLGMGWDELKEKMEA